MAKKKNDDLPDTPHNDDKPTETKAEKFRRLAIRRVPKAVKAIHAIAALANRSAYEFTPEQRDKILATLADAMSSLKNRYNGVDAVAQTFDL